MDDLVTINRPIQDVFNFVADHSNDRLWKPFVTTSKQISAGPVGVGAQFEIGMIVGSRYRASIVEIVEYEPYKWYVYKSGAQPLFTFIAHLAFASVASGTAVRGHVEFQARGLWRWVVPFIRVFFKSQEKRTFYQLKKVMENASN